MPILRSIPQPECCCGSVNPIGIRSCHGYPTIHDFHALLAGS